MTEIKILTVEWTDPSDERIDSKQIFSWMGGRIKGEGWDEYLKGIKPEVWPYLEVLKASVIENKLRISGQEHDKDDGCTPIFSDGRWMSLSWRAWGDLMAAIWNTEENANKYTYMDFYM